MKRLTLALLVTLPLAACGDRETAPADSPQQAVEEETGPPPAQSIIRSDIEEAKEVPLEPLEARVGFPEGGSELDEDALEGLARLLESAQYQAGGPIILRGHTDSSGRDEANLRAAQARAEAVRDYLIDQGVTEDRITVIAFGEQNPVEPNALPDGSPNEEGRAANRRVDITVEVPNSPDAAEEGAPDNATDGGGGSPAAD